MWASCLSCSSSQNGRHPPPGLVPVFWYKIRETVMFNFSPNCFYYCMFIRIYICAGIHLSLPELFPKHSHLAKWWHHPLPNQGGSTSSPLVSYWIYTKEQWLLWLNEWTKAGIGVHACNPNTQNEGRKICRLKTSLSYIYIARACLKEYGRNIILGFLRGKMNIADYCTVCD